MVRPFGRAILDRRIIRIDNMEAEPGLDPTLRRITAKSNVTTPIMRGDAVIGAIGMGSREKGAPPISVGVRAGTQRPRLAHSNACLSAEVQSKCQDDGHARQV